MKTANVRILAVAMIVCGLCLLLPALGQKTNGNGKFSMKGDNSRVSTLIADLMTKAHANYTLDSGLEESYATIRLNKVSLQTALAALTKASSRPFTYQINSGVYNFSMTGATSLDSFRVTLQTQNSDLPSVISSLMDTVHASYALDSEIKRARTVTVTLNLTNVSFSVALDSLIKTSRLPIACVKEIGSKTGLDLYHFMLKSKADEIQAKAEGRVKYTDASLQKGGDLADKKVTLEFRDVYLSHALKIMLDKYPIRFEIDASVEDATFNLNLDNISLPDALKAIIKASGQPIVYSFEKDVMHFRR